MIRSRRAVGFTLAALLIHFLLVAVLLKLDLPARAPKPPEDPIHVASVSRARVQELKRKFLLQKSSAETDAPKEARYESAKNRSVEQETRARHNDVVPSRAQTQEKKTPPLAKLGLALPSPQSPEESSPIPSADQALVDEDRLAVGNENVLNTRESLYYSFYSRLYESIGPIWKSRVRSQRPARQLSFGNYTSVVEVVLSHQGELEAVVLIASSGVPEFDQAALSAWRLIARFPNPPKGLIGSDGKVRTRWSFTVEMGPGFHWEYEEPRQAS